MIFKCGFAGDEDGGGSSFPYLYLNNKGRFKWSNCADVLTKMLKDKLKSVIIAEEVYQHNVNKEDTAFHFFKEMRHKIGLELELASLMCELHLVLYKCFVSLLMIKQRTHSNYAGNKIKATTQSKLDYSLDCTLLRI
uniref:Uncharacterized protein n=1 Tax=Tetranychus urticae TaxID=32264 RepID=T1KXZ6_TETUR